MKSRLFSMAIYLAASISGLLVLLYPFFLPAVATQSGFGTYRAGELPAMMTLLLGLCLLVIISEAQGPMANTKLIALLGVLVAINSALRFIETAIPGPGGFTFRPDDFPEFTPQRKKSVFRVFTVPLPACIDRIVISSGIF